MKIKTSNFTERVFAVVRKIPKGQTRNYAQVAVSVGSSRAARAVGNALHTNYDATIPCHRVIRSGGITGGYNRGTEQKQKLLHEEHAL